MATLAHAPLLRRRRARRWCSSRRGVRARRRGSLPDVALADLPPEAREVNALIRKGGPFRYDRDGVVFGNREQHPAGEAARLLSRVHGAARPA